MKKKTIGEKREEPRTMKGTEMADPQGRRFRYPYPLVGLLVMSLGPLHESNNDAECCGA